VGYLFKGLFSIETLWRSLIGPPDHRQSGQCLLDPRVYEGAESWELLLVAHFCPWKMGLGLGLTVFHRSGDPLGPTLSFSQHRCAHMHWNCTSASQQFCISLGQTVTIIRITARSGLGAAMIRLRGRKTVTSRLCKALVTNLHVLLAEVASDTASQPIVGPYSPSVPVSLHQDRSGHAAILRHRYACLRDSAHHVGTRAKFWDHFCNGPATNAEVGRGVGCPRKFVSEISSTSREGPPGQLGVSWNRGLVTFKRFLRAPVQNQERCIRTESHVRCRGHCWSRRSARFFVERLYVIFVSRLDACPQPRCTAATC